MLFILTDENLEPSMSFCFGVFWGVRIGDIMLVAFVSEASTWEYFFQSRNLLNACTCRYELKWIRGKCKRVANSGAFSSVSQVYHIGHMRLPELVRNQCFKSASQLLDSVFEMMIMGHSPNYID